MEILLLIIAFMSAILGTLSQVVATTTQKETLAKLLGIVSFVSVWIAAFIFGALAGGVLIEYLYMWLIIE
jgi:hypothetical protein